MSDDPLKGQIDDIFSEIDAENPGLIQSFDIQSLQVEQQEYLLSLDDRERCLYLLGSAHGMLGMMPVFNIDTTAPAFSILLNTSIKLSLATLSMAGRYPPEERNKIIEGVLTAQRSIETIPQSFDARQRMANMIIHLFDADTALLRTIDIMRQDADNETIHVHARQAQAELEMIPESFRTLTEINIIIQHLYSGQAEMLNSLQALVTEMV